jgi:hypothetical protein
MSCVKNPSFSDDLRTIRRLTRLSLQTQSEVAISSNKSPESRENCGFQQRRHRYLWGLPGESRPKAQRAQSQHRLLGDSNPTRSLLPTATSLAFTGFFFPLLKSVLRMDGQPAIRQQGLQCSRVSPGSMAAIRRSTSVK